MKKIAKLLAIISVVSVIMFADTAQAQEFDGNFLLESKSALPPRIRKPFAPPINMGRREQKPAKIYPSRVPVRPTPRYLPSKPQPSHDKRGRFVPRVPRR